MAATKATPAVRVAEEIVSGPEPYMMHHTRTIHRWVITIPGTRYRCEITECPCGLRRQTGVTYARVPLDAEDWATRPREITDVSSVELINCTCASEACHRKNQSKSLKCHGWHRPRVDKVVAELDKTLRRPARGRR